MEVLKARAGMLSHYEVYQHVLAQREDNNALLKAAQHARQKNRAISDQDEEALAKLPLRTPKEMQEDKELLVRGTSEDLVLITEALYTYFTSEFSSTPRQTPRGIKDLIALLQPYQFTKSEQWQLVNYLPSSLPCLYNIVEELENRVEGGDDQQNFWDLVDAIQATLLPAPEQPAEVAQMEVDPEEEMGNEEEEEMGAMNGQVDFVDEGKWGGAGGVEDEGDGEIDG